MDKYVQSLGVIVFGFSLLISFYTNVVAAERPAGRCGYGYQRCPTGYDCVKASNGASTCRRIDLPTYVSRSTGRSLEPSPTASCNSCTGAYSSRTVSIATQISPYYASSIYSRRTGTPQPTGSYPDPSGRNYTAVIGASRSSPVQVAERLPIDVLQRDHVDQFNMYILALESLQRRAENDDLSWYQLGGIHGYPHIPWQYPSSPTDNTNYGYCTHSSIIFLPWHRPYVLLFEQVLVEEAVTIAKKFSGSAAAKYQEAAINLRAPYWDWASNDTGSRIPEIVSKPNIDVVKSGPDGTESRSSIANPLYSYRFAAVHADGGLSAATSRSSSADDELKNEFPSNQQSTLGLFSITDFNSFSSRAEGVHGGIHLTVGGDMAIVDRAGFDPIFWLHHCQVDRLYSLYQATHPGVVLTADGSSTYNFALHGDKPDDLLTPLYPFRHPNGIEFNSDDIKTAQSTFTYGYTYPEVPVGLSEQDLQTYTTRAINKLYSPSLNDGSFDGNASGAQAPTARLEWNANVLVNSDDVNGSHRVLFYLGNSNNSNSSLSNNDRNVDTLVGVAGIFTGTKAMPDGSNPMLNLTVPLTSDLVKNNIALRANDTVPELANRLYWVVEKVQNTVDEVPPANIQSLKIAISSTVTEYFPDTARLPVKSEPLTYYTPTAGKDGGLQPGEAPPVGNVAPPVLDNPSATNATVARVRMLRRM